MCYKRKKTTERNRENHACANWKYQQRKRPIRKNQTEILGLKITVTELKNSLERFNIRLDHSEKMKYQTQGQEVIKQEEQKEKRMKKSEESL